MTKAKDKADSGQPSQFDDVLKRMLSTPPKPHKEDKAKPEGQPSKNKPAK